MTRAVPCLGGSAQAVSCLEGRQLYGPGFLGAPSDSRIQRQILVLVAPGVLEVLVVQLAQGVQPCQSFQVHQQAQDLLCSPAQTEGQGHCGSGPQQSYRQPNKHTLPCNAFQKSENPEINHLPQKPYRQFTDLKQQGQVRFTGAQA